MLHMEWKSYGPIPNYGEMHSPQTGQPRASFPLIRRNPRSVQGSQSVIWHGFPRVSFTAKHVQSWHPLASLASVSNCRPSEQGGHCEQADVPDPGCGPGILSRWKNYVSEHKTSIYMNIYVKVFIDWFKKKMSINIFVTVKSIQHCILVPWLLLDPSVPIWATMAAHFLRKAK